MPGIVQTTSQVFWNTEDILNMARVLVNDTQSDLAGQDLADARPGTWVLLNLCYAKLSNWLEDNNVESATYAEAIISIPASASFTDPNAVSSLFYTGYTDASGATYETPTLPADLLEPLQLWVRNSGQNVAFHEMTQAQGGLDPAYYRGTLSTWEFRGNNLYFSGGSYTPVDVRIRYIPALPSLVKQDVGKPPQVIPFAHAGEALAYMVAAEFAEIRNAPNGPGLRMKANEQLAIIANKSAKRSNQSQVRRQGYGFRRRRTTWL